MSQFIDFNDWTRQRFKTEVTNLRGTFGYFNIIGTSAHYLMLLNDTLTSDKITYNLTGCTRFKINFFNIINYLIKVVNIILHNSFVKITLIIYNIGLLLSNSNYTNDF